MADLRPFSTPSPLLIFPSASPTSKLKCKPTRKPPSPINWTEECYQSMILETNDTQYHHRRRLIDEQNESNHHFKENIARGVMMVSTLKRHSTPDFMALYRYENLSPASSEPPNLVPTNLEFKSGSPAPSSTNLSSNNSSNLSIISSSTSSMSYISSMSSSEDNDNESQPNIHIVLKPRLHRPRYVSMSNERNSINYTGTSWYSSSVQSIPTTIRENQYQQRFAKKKSKFSLLVEKMKRAAERPFKMLDDSVI